MFEALISESPSHTPGLCQTPSPRPRCKTGVTNANGHKDDALVFQELRVPRNGDPHVGVSPVRLQNYDNSPYR